MHEQVPEKVGRLADADSENIYKMQKIEINNFIWDDWRSKIKKENFRFGLQSRWRWCETSTCTRRLVEWNFTM